MVRIAVDLMGGDASPQEIFEAALAIAKEIFADSSLILLAQHSILPHLRSAYGPFPDAISFLTTEEVVEMDESPLLAVRRKKGSTMMAGIRLLQEKKADAFLSCGNTGALVAFATLYLNPLPSIDRPALLVMVPHAKGRVVVLDVGANIAPKPGHLLSYAVMGSLYRQCLLGESNPTIGLLNIGTEEQKGTQELKETYHLLQQEFNGQFLGNVEGREVYQGKIDVLVTDGFTGNVFLKTSEGISRFLVEYLQKNFAVDEIVSHLHQRFDYSKHPGAFLCGVEGVIVKCHGYSETQALINGLRGAHELVKKNLVGQLKTLLSKKAL